tara:strand:- start:1830 stop:2429 length:600 start_codon:yes stop_codon:yes gene_type:complete
MLGIGNGLPASSGSYNLIDTYTSDFTGGAGDNSSTWGDWAIEGGSLAITTNTDSIGGENDWLKFVFPANQTHASGVYSNLGNLAIQRGDIFHVTYKLFLAGDWEGSDDVSISNRSGSGDRHKMRFKTDGEYGEWSNISAVAAVAIPQDTVCTINSEIYMNNLVTNSKLFIYTGSNDDEPQANAEMYIKDVEVKTYRLFG